MLKSIVDLYASLILAPAILLGLGGPWTELRSVELGDASLVSPAFEGRAAGGALHYAYTPLALREDSEIAERAAPLRPGEYLELRLPQPMRTFAVTLQADARQSYRIAVSSDGETFRDFWLAPGSMLEDEGLMARTSPLLTEPEPVAFLRITPETGRGRPVVAGVRLERRSWRFASVALVTLPWLLWLALVPWLRAGGTPGAAERIRGLWSRADVFVAAALVALTAFDVAGRPAATALWTAGLAVLLAVPKAAARRVSPQTALAATFSLAVAGLVAPRLWLELTLARVAAIHDLDVDHRNQPDGDEINSDGVRFRGEASDLRDEDFVVLFLGDSFTYGLRLDYDAAYPSAAERALRARGCPPDVRIVNFGWASSSPLLGFRMLRDVGAKYRPDLVVYNLDMTDFHDDLRYEAELRELGGRAFGPGEVLWAALVARVPALEALGARVVARAPLRATPVAGGGGEVPSDRFFVTSRPLDASRELIERGVVRNLARIQRYAEDELGAPLVVLVLPRAYQHSREESPRNWERARYEVLGPFVLEPFRYFDELDDALPYPLFSLLPAFRAATRSPLYFPDDPHWNATGAGVAARAAAGHLLTTGLLPCPAPEDY